MTVSELCRNGISVRLVRDSDQTFLQVCPSDEADGRTGMIPCNPDVLYSVLRGLTYQLASDSAYCIMRRVGDSITLEYQVGKIRGQGQLEVAEYARIIRPTVPAHLRAHLM